LDCSGVAADAKGARSTSAQLTCVLLLTTAAAAAAVAPI
jgi:hypothetical protein